MNRPPKHALPVEARGPDGPVRAVLLPPEPQGVKVTIVGGGFLRSALVAYRPKFERELRKAMKRAADEALKR